MLIIHIFQKENSSESASTSGVVRNLFGDPIAGRNVCSNSVNCARVSYVFVSYNTYNKEIRLLRAMEKEVSKDQAKTGGDDDDANSFTSCNSTTNDDDDCAKKTPWNN